MGLSEEIKEVKELLLKAAEEKKVKEKKFRYPFGKKVGKSQRKKDYVTTMIIKNNSNVEWKKYQIKDQTIMHDLIPRLATAGHVLFDKKGNPIIVLPEWSVEPFSPQQHFNDSLDNGSNIKGYKILASRMLSEKVEDKKKMAGWVKWVIGIVIVGGLIFALVSGSGGKAPVPA
jgi:hypothetical protein